MDLVEFHSKFLGPVTTICTTLQNLFYIYFLLQLYSFNKNLLSSGPPPGRPGMPGGPGGLPPRLGIRMPPGPPPGLPPSRLMHHHPKGQLGTQAKDSKGVTTITAKPQIRFVYLINHC